MSVPAISWLGGSPENTGIIIGVILGADVIGLQAAGQRDPLVMYKKEGHEMFQGLQARIQHDIVHTVYHLGFAANGDKARGGKSKAAGGASVMTRVVGTRSREAVTDGGRKVGRNDQCPCGSGKKYKKCHGKAA